MNDPSIEPMAKQGLAADASDPAALRAALDCAADYRGDVTITRRSTSQAIEGYVFDRRIDRTTGSMTIRMIPVGSDERIAIEFADIARIEFTGRDTASGKSFETWIKKYIEKKSAGESAGIESETLE